MSATTTDSDSFRFAAVSMAALASSALHGLACEHGCGREQPLTARSRPLVVVEKLERAFSQLQNRDIGRRADIECPAVIERVEDARRVDRRTRDDLAERHAQHDEL